MLTTIISNYICKLTKNKQLKNKRNMSKDLKNEVRKSTPIFTGFIKYFPNAIAEVSKASLIANEQHHAGEPLHWDKNKSKDELDSLMRHLTDYASGEDLDSDGIMHLTKVAWRSLAMLERTITKTL